MDGTERIDFNVEAAAEDDAGAGRLRRRNTGRSVIDRGDEWLVDRRDGVGGADGQRGDVAAAEGEPEEQRRQEAGGETASIGLPKRGDETRRARHHRSDFFIPPASIGAVVLAQPFTAPAVSPCTMYLCR